MGAVDAKPSEPSCEAAFSPSKLEIEDDSARHTAMPAPRRRRKPFQRRPSRRRAFAGLGRRAAQRLVYAALADELAGPVHALSLKALAPGEAT